MSTENFREIDRWEKMNRHRSNKQKGIGLVRDYEKSFSKSITRQEEYAVFFAFRRLGNSASAESGGRESVQIKTVSAAVSQRSHRHVHDLLEIRQHRRQNG